MRVPMAGAVSLMRERRGLATNLYRWMMGTACDAADIPTAGVELRWESIALIEQLKLKRHITNTLPALRLAHAVYLDSDNVPILKITAAMMTSAFSGWELVSLLGGVGGTTFEEFGHCRC